MSSSDLLRDILTIKCYFYWYYLMPCGTSERNHPIFIGQVTPMRRRQPRLIKIIG
ncbi:MAG: hypothetical protein GF329_18425 [Candidatus Lokiarchaeota archaeon]|nr:hypothetical protein [Candidatus Lokiarchaeota archaeon]